MTRKISFLALLRNALCCYCPIRRGAAANENSAHRIPDWCLSFPVSARNEAFRQGLRELGYVEGKNIVIEWRSYEGKRDLRPALAAELVRLKVDVIVAAGSGEIRAAKEATATIPIVMLREGDPVGKRFRRQPGAAGREHYWIGNPSPGAERKTTGASEGDRSQALARGRLREFRRARTTRKS